MTPKQRKLQDLDFAYGNLACTNNHKPSRRPFAKLFMKRGFTFAEFAEWAADKEWRDE